MFQRSVAFFAVAALPRMTAQAQPVLHQSRPDLFTYFDPRVQGMSPESDTVSKGIIHLSSYNRILNAAEGTEGTAFLINTFRDDNKVCMCLAGHQISMVSPAGIPVTGSAVHLNSDIFMDYLGKDTVIDGEHINMATHFSKSFLGTVMLLDYHYEFVTDGERTIPSKDAALVLVDKRYLPSAFFATLGYEFRDDNWSSGQYYNIGHPFSYPQRISDWLSFASELEFATVFNSSLPGAMGSGSSGSPLLTRPAGDGEFSTVRGILSSGQNVSTFQASFKTNPSELATFRYYISPKFSKMKLLESAIRKHCWRTKDSAAISTSGSYKPTVIADNSATVGRYSRNYEVKSSGSLTDAAVFTEVASDVEITRLNANNCTISSFELPNTFAGNGKPWQVAVAAKQIDVGADFNYAASGASELELSTVVIGTALSSAIRQADNVASVQNIDQDENGFNVYPNPSPDGTFNISLPATGQYRLEIHSLDGKEIYAAGCSSRPFRFALSAVSRGTYLLMVFNTRHNELMCQKLIVY